MLELGDLRVCYDQVEAVRSVSFKVADGSIFAILGANGAGKTTLLRAILGLNRASGSIRFLGAEIGRLPTFERVRLGMALVPEGRRLFPAFTVEENLRIGTMNRRDTAEIRSDLEEVYEFFPILRERYRQQAQTLSGGEGQMLAIGRALLSRPKMLLLDEPSVGLMPRAVAEIFSNIARVSKQKGLTVLLVEQNARKALSIADSAGVLELGRLVLTGRARDIAGDARVREAYLGG
ncbi:MAG TPA: ABC transporter ATP-binding protein [Xanthobacteraceae bacterium]|jgi:branched-chain amino acid transport system ATP-binding protein